MPATVMRMPNFPPYSNDGMISPSIAAASMTPAAKDNTISENLCDIFLNAKPISAPKTVAPPTPSAVKSTISIAFTDEVPFHLPMSAFLLINI